jgi:hypothetical protein
MSLLDRALRGKLVRVRDGAELEISGSINGDLLIAEFGSDVRYGDILRDNRGEEFVVERCKRNESPSGNLDHLEAKVVPKHEWEATRRDRDRAHVTQHIGTAHAVAGRDITGDTSINVTPERVAEQLELLIMGLPLPKAEKKSIWAKVGSALGSLSAGAAKAFVDGLVK